MKSIEHIFEELIKNSFKLLVNFVSAFIGIIKFLGAISALVLLFKLYPSIFLKYALILLPIFKVFGYAFQILIILVIVFGLAYIGISLNIKLKKEVKQNGKGRNKTRSKRRKESSRNNRCNN